MSFSHHSKCLFRGQFVEITFFFAIAVKKTAAPKLGRLSQSSFSGRRKVEKTVTGDVVLFGPMKGTFPWSDMASNSTQQHKVIYERSSAVVSFQLLRSAVSPWIFMLSGTTKSLFMSFHYGKGGAVGGGSCSREKWRWTDVTFGRFCSYLFADIFSSGYCFFSPFMYSRLEFTFTGAELVD